MPGVVVTTAVRTGPNATNVAPASAFFVAGTSERGTTTAAKLVTSLAEFEGPSPERDGQTRVHLGQQWAQPEARRTPIPTFCFFAGIQWNSNTLRSI